MDQNNTTNGENTAATHICGPYYGNPQSTDKLKKMLSLERRFNQAAELFKVMGDYGRSRILYCLMEGEFCVCEISSLVEMSHSAVSHQLRILRANRLVKYRRKGKQIYYSLDDDHVRNLMHQAMSHVDETEGTGYEQET
ncbi:MAG: metalloregulator ArsR/SmtB family transcription factor [Firmicutes bacterium]|nr:metalloregulator ArsR/SmtB family transcription factor [Bacillota bacterium]